MRTISRPPSPRSSTERPTGAAPDSALYRRVWRWHFYAGLVCLPFLVLLAVTGGAYLFKDAIESRLYAALRAVPATDAPPMSAAALVARATAAVPGRPVRVVPAAAPGRTAEVGIATARGVVAVHVDPADGRVVGTLADDDRLMAVVRRVHSLAIAGPVGNHAIEVVAGWSIVLVVSGVFLWWPRGRSGGVVSVRGRPGRRVWWRDVHAVTGLAASAAIVFLAVTGMPWSVFWGERFGQLTSAAGWGVPPQVWGPPPALSPPSGSAGAARPLDGLPAVPWALGQVPVPVSATVNGVAGPGQGAGAGDGHGHGDGDGHGKAGAIEVPVTSPPPDAAPFPSRGIGLDDALQRFAALGLPAGTPVRLPDGPRGVYSALRFPDDVRDVRVVHLDRHSGAVLADIGYADYGPVGRVTEWGVSLHTGRQFGWANQVVLLAGCVAIVVLAVSAVAMWWKRRPRGRLAAPPRREGDRAAGAALAVAVGLGLLYPLLGASMVAVVLVDRCVPARWRTRFGL